ncbi:hypothetical protein Tco_0002689, partial [Tanacetum coccineum]
MSPSLAPQIKLIWNLVPRRKDLILENAMEDSILERNRENLHFKLSWMLLLSLRAIPHFSSLQMFRMDKKKKFDLNLEIFRDIFQICPRVHGQNFDELPTDEDIVSFFKELGHTGEIKTITDIVVDQMHQPWRTFATIINRSLSGKTTGLDKLRLSRAQILWGMYYKKNVDYVELLWEDFTYQIDNRGIDFALEVAITEELSNEEVRKKSLRDFHKTHPSGSGTVTKLAPSAAKIKPSITNEGTGVKPGVPDVTEEESTKSEVESWGKDEDDNNNNHDSRSEGSDQERDSGDDNTRSDNEKGSDSEHETDENEMGSESDQEENEEDVEDDEEEKEDELVKTPSNSTDDEDETNVKDKDEGAEDEGMDYTTNQFDDDVDLRMNEPVTTDEGFIQKEGTDAEMTNVQQGNENPEITLNQVIKDAHVTLFTILQKTKVPVTSSSHSSDLASKFLNFSDIPHTYAEIVSLMDVHVHQKVPSKQTPTLLIVHVSVITDSSPVYSTVIRKSLPSITPPPQQSTLTPQPTTKATNPPFVLPN